MVEPRQRPNERRGRGRSLHEEMRRLADSLLGPSSTRGRRPPRGRSEPGGRTDTSRSPADPEYEVLESDDAYILGLHVPGHRREDLTVEVADDTITVTGRSEEAFRSRFPLSGEVAEEEITAAYRDGILAVRIPKYALSSPGREIEITFPED